MALLWTFVSLPGTAQIVGPMLPVATPTPRLTPAQLPPKAPEILYKAGNLTIIADNCTLSSILHGVEKRTGIKLEGTPPEDRMFGKFGPGTPRDVLNQLFGGFKLDYILQGSTDPSSVEKITLNHRGAMTAQMVAAFKPQPQEAVPAQEGQPETNPDEVMNDDEGGYDPLDQPVAGQGDPEVPENTEGTPTVNPDGQNVSGQVPAPPTPQQLLDRLRQIQNQQQNLQNH